MKRALVAGAAVILGGMVPLSGCASFDPPKGPSPVGIWGEPDGPHLDLGEDGRLSGSDGCNRLMGTWEAEGQTVEFVGVATTMMACLDIDDWLSRLRTGTVDGDEMTIFNIDGGEIGLLARQ